MKTGKYERTPEIREKNRQATLKKFKGKSNPFKGRKHSEETKKKISLANKGNKHSQEHRNKVSKALMGNKNRLGIPHTPKARKKIGRAIRGEKHPNWKGGKSNSGRNRIEYIEWREAVFKDIKSCSVCNKDNVRLVAHHIKPREQFPELEFDTKNGIVLCRSCHHAVHLIRALLENGVNSGELLLIKKLIGLME